MTLEFIEKTYTVRFVKSTYRNGNLYLGLQNEAEDGEWESFCDITVNFDVKCELNCAFLHMSDMSKEIYNLIRPYIKETGRVMENGYAIYPEVIFDSALVSSAVEL